jgi:hypothetical protein
MSKIDTVEFTIEEVKTFKKAINGLSDFAEALHQHKFHLLSDIRGEIINNFQPIFPKLSKFLNMAGYKIEYSECLLEYFFEDPDAGRKAESDRERKSPYKLKKRPLRMLSDVLNRNDGELDISQKPVSLDNFFETIGMELSCLLNHVIDPDSAMYYNDEYEKKTYDACSARIGRLVEKLKAISNFAFDNNKSYQLATKELSQEPQQSGKPGKNAKMSLREFLEKCADVNFKIIDSKIKRIKAVDKSKKLLPKTANKPKGNQTKLYYEKDLIAIWPKLKDEIPTLPKLKI